MTYDEFLASLRELNPDEQFYLKYYQAKKANELDDFFRQYTAAYCRKRNYVIPELKETMPPYMTEEYVISGDDKGFSIQKHNCYSPEFTHFHTFFECLYVYEGTCTHTFHGEKQILKQGDFAVIPPGVAHSVGVFDSSIIINLILSRDVIENTFKNPTYYKENELSRFFIQSISQISSNNFLLFHTYGDTEIRELILKMALESKNKFPEMDAILNGSYAILFALLLRFYSNSITIYGKRLYKEEKANKMVLYIQDHHSSISLPQLAAEFGYTTEYVSKYIKESTGKTFMDILIESRLKHATLLLKTTSLSLESIALQIGYQNTENFIRIFKKAYGMTPSSYRRKEA